MEEFIYSILNRMFLRCKLSGPEATINLLNELTSFKFNITLNNSSDSHQEYKFSNDKASIFVNFVLTNDYVSNIEVYE